VQKYQCQFTIFGTGIAPPEDVSFVQQSNCTGGNNIRVLTAIIQYLKYKTIQVNI
jgi:hypothetical protein